MIVEDCGNFSDYQTCNFGKELEKEDENGPRSYRVGQIHSICIGN
jgi:hypothetical protein